MILELAGELVDGNELVLVIPGAIALSLVGILAYLVKKRDRQRERVARAHRPPPERSQDTGDGNGG